ncbi:hydrolase [Mycolicibacterium novocastrense]|uniref:zinc-dependent metalloprotease n=1 Tax=Mycolicibacterium novocastrense TaxID=59813 RepID=UPI000747CA38|nr:zinc-dependent metalloprotease [Mycolicibacterium novocastrense]KUH66188.1 hydrolase [Mycolicibacterium novocastrense]KUH66670.1 hydrolase [Mycolicibacterium novocastrense]KUH74222.1 hydrolase [Mycolicibacterium novocastrense]
MQRVSPSAKSSLSVGRAVDWDFAATVGEKLARPGPASTDYTRRQVIEQLAEASRSAELPVREVTGMTEGGEIPEARIVDRPQWIRAATRSMRVMTGGSDKPAGAISGRITGAQTGAVLAFISSGILGQYDPFGPGGGELLLIYPNVIAVERQLQVQPYDFRLWVCLHEVTHRVQFRANPWLAEHMSGALAVLTEEGTEDIAEMVSRLASFVRSRRDESNGAVADANSSGMIGLLRAVQSEPQREALDKLLVLGTLLEGHADHVMDAVGPAVVPSVATIRKRFDERRQRKQSPLQRVVRMLLGIDAKLSQYTRGKAFVDHVVSAVGMDRFNAVWTGPETLPLPTEIDEPHRWIDRVL